MSGIGVNYAFRMTVACSYPEDTNRPEGCRGRVHDVKACPGCGAPMHPAMWMPLVLPEYPHGLPKGYWCEEGHREESFGGSPAG